MKPQMQSPETAWDDVNDVEVRTITGVSGVDHDAEADIGYTVLPKEDASLPLRCLYAPSASDTLVVSFHGSLLRSKYQLPRFEWRKTLRRLDAGALMIADTTLELSDSMPLSWYVGTDTSDLTKDLAEFIRSFADNGGYSRIVLVGSSGGGFAAMAISRRLPGSLAVAFSPQNRIGDYVPWVQKRFVATAFPKHRSIEAVEEEYPGRVNISNLYSSGPSPQNYVHYVQNSNDNDHVEKHFRPFAEAVKVDPMCGGEDPSGRISLILEPMSKGHEPPSRGRFIRHIKAGHERAFGLPLANSRPPTETPGIREKVESPAIDSKNGRSGQWIARFRQLLPRVPFRK